jgi:3'-5' exoribonuclease
MNNLIKLNNQPRLENSYNFSRFKGTYYLVGCVDGFDSQKNHIKKIQISDATDTLTIYCRDQTCIVGDLKPESLVDIEIAVDMSGKTPYFRCKMIQNSNHGINQVRSIYQLPIARCSYPSVLTSMLNMLEHTYTPELREFVNNVLSQPNIGMRFIQCPASLNHHHNVPGGLLLHSYDVASRFFFDTSLTEVDKDVGVVSGLLHDIGKTLTLTPDGTRTDLGYQVDHDQLTLDICSPALTILSATHKELADRLRHNWTCATPNARYGYKAKTKIARQLKIYDNNSAKFQPSLFKGQSLQLI